MHHRTGQVFPRWPAATVAAALLLACHLGDQRDARACPQTGEFGNYGCAVVEGAVVGARGQPLGGVAVAPGPSADGGQFDTPFHYTDASGRFELRLTRYVSAPSDSASVWIHANVRSEEHTSELQSQSNLVCRLLLEKKKNTTQFRSIT